MVYIVKKKESKEGRKERREGGRKFAGKTNKLNKAKKINRHS